MEPKIGENLVRARRLAGMTQEQLHDASGVSLSTIQDLEQGKRTTARMKTLGKLAAALKVTTGALLGDASDTDPSGQREPDDDPADLIGVRRALTPVRGLDCQPLGIDPTGPPPAAADVATAIRDANRIYHGNDYAATLARLPGLLGQARALVDLAATDDRPAAHALASRAYGLAGRLLIQLRKVDLAHVALDAALRHARDSGDQVVGAEAVAPMCWLLLRVGRFGEAKHLALRTAAQVEPRMSLATVAELSAWGHLLIKAASAAVRDASHDEARDILDLAAPVAQHLGDRVSPHADMSGNDFSAEGVHLMRVEAEVIADHPDRALTLAEQAPRSPQITPSARQRSRLDVAWSRVQLGQHAEATAVLLELRDTAPMWLGQQPYAREIVTEIVDNQRRASTNLVALASLVGCSPM